MKLVTNRNQPYRKCIDSNCDKLPTNVLKSILVTNDTPPRYLTNLILFCDDYDLIAYETANKDSENGSFSTKYFINIRHPEWLKREQKYELEGLRQELSSRRRKEG